MSDYENKYYQSNLAYLDLIELIRYYSVDTYNKIFNGKEGHLKLLIDRQVTQDAYEQLDYEFRLTEIKRLKAENEKLKKDIIELVDLGTDQVVTEKIVRLEAQLAKAEEVIKFYANPIHWDDRILIRLSDEEPTKTGDYTGGKRAREYLRGKG